MRNYINISLLSLSLIFLMLELFGIEQGHFITEFIFTAVIILSALLSILGIVMDKKIFAVITYSLILLNAVYIIFISTIPVILLILSAAGIMISFSENKRRKVKKRGMVEEIKNDDPFVASRLGKKYHIPSCDWARKIALNRRIHFKDKQSAKKAGFRPCLCIRR